MAADTVYQRFVDVCVENATDDPVKLFRMLIRDPEVPMHSRMHHVIVPMVLVTAYWSVVRDFDLRSYLNETAERASEVPEMICGYWGTCGSAVGTGVEIGVQYFLSSGGSFSASRSSGSGSIPSTMDTTVPLPTLS